MSYGPYHGPYGLKLSKYPLDADKVKALMRERGLSPYRLANRLNTTPASIYRALEGSRNLKLLKAIARALGVALEDIQARPESEGKAA
jgi:transcriptional regulator with XRE-family HTH domain